MEQLLARHYDRLHAVCRRIMGNQADAADATQEALIAIVRGLPRFDGRSSFGTWAYRIATNASLDELRRRKRRPATLVPGSDDRDYEHVDPNSHVRIDQIAERDVVEAALRDLPEEFRLPVVLRDVADLDYNEIASTLKVPVGTVKSRISRGRAMLAAALGNQLDPTERPSEEP